VFAYLRLLDIERYTTVFFSVFDGDRWVAVYWTGIEGRLFELYVPDHKGAYMTFDNEEGAIGAASAIANAMGAFEEISEDVNGENALGAHGTNVRQSRV